jgi:hypothetical protein
VKSNRLSPHVFLTPIALLLLQALPARNPAAAPPGAAPPAPSSDALRSPEAADSTGAAGSPDSLTVPAPAVGKGRSWLGRTLTWRDLLWEEQRFRLAPGTLRYDLSYGFLDPGSETLLLEGARLGRGRDYRIEYRRGSLLLGPDYRGGGSYFITYRRRPVRLSPSYRLRSPEGYEVVEAAPREARAETPDGGPLPSLPPGLRVAGSKTISVEGGSGRSVNLDQALKASIQGELASGVNVNALLSDENLPIQPEGNTEELENIDKVFVEVEGKGARAQLGDMTFRNDWSRFTPVERTFQGVQGELRKGDWSVLSGVARSRGEYETVEFRGEEGLQGPYELLEVRRLNDVVILAGTEKVWLDGERLTRGENHDYVMDYDAGTITFTPRRPITRDSEITIDYQFTTESYQRGSFWSETTGKAGAALRWNALYFREQDDEGDPRAITLSEEDRAALASAGDDPTAALSSGVERVPVGEGSYVRVPADSIPGLPEHYAFVETGGEYRLDFTRVPAGEGDYGLDGLSTSGRKVYAFVGAGGGDYVIGKEIPLPLRHEVAAVALEGQAGGLLRWKGEGDLSVLDRNTVSDRDDGDNTGGALRLQAQLDPWAEGEAEPSWGALRLGGAFERVGADFVSLTKTREGFFYRDWNLEEAERKEGESVAEVEAGWRKGDWGRLRGSYGRLDRSGEAESDRMGLGLDLGSSRERRTALEVLRSDTETGRDSLAASARRTRWTTETAYGFWELVPSVRVERERYYQLYRDDRPDTGRTYVRQIYRLERRNPGRFSFGLGHERRDTDRLLPDGSDWSPSRSYRRWDLNVSYRLSGLSGRLELNHRETAFLGGSARAREKVDLARAEVEVSPLRSWFRSDLSYEINRTRERTLQKAVVFVGENQGSFNQAGEEVGKNRGDYNVVFLPGEDRLPVREVKADLHLGFEDREARASGGLRSWLRANASLNQYLSVVERSTTDRTLELYLLNPSLLQRNDVTVFGRVYFRQDLRLLRAVPDRDLLLRFEREDVEDNRFEGVSEETLLERETARFDQAFSEHWTGQAEVELTRRRRTSDQPSLSRGQLYDVRSRRGKLTGGYRFNRSWRTELESEVELREDDPSGTRQTLLSLAPSLSATPRSGLAVFAQYRLVHTDSRETSRGKPFFFTEQGALQTWSVNAQLRLSRHIVLSLNYFGRREKDVFGTFDTFHDFKAESRASF